MKDSKETFEDYLWDRAMILIDKATRVMTVAVGVIGGCLVIFNIVRYFLQ